MKLPFETVRECHMFVLTRVGDELAPSEDLLSSLINEFSDARGIDPDVMCTNFIEFGKFVQALQSLIDDGWIEQVKMDEVN